MNEVGLWSVTDGMLQKRFLGGGAPPDCVVFSPNGAFLAAVGGFRGIDTTIKIWQPSDGTLVKVLQTRNEYSVGQLAFSPDSRLLLAGTDQYSHFGGGIGIWRTGDWTQLHHMPVKGDYVAFSPDGELFAAARSDVNRQVAEMDLWRVRDARLITRFRDPNHTNVFLGRLAFSPDGSRILRTGSIRSNTIDGTVFAGFISALNLPMVLSPARNDLNNLVITVSGGTGRFRLVRRATLSSGPEEIGDVIHARQITLPLSGGQAFFQVLEAP
jgi:WD40 repeat protein